MLRFVATTLALLLTVSAHAQTPSPQQQIDLAVQAAPEALRDGATVLGYGEGRGESGALTTLREGEGDLICVADEPGNDRFHAACYHASLSPFMQRGRELRRQGVAKVDSVRRAELEAGTWSMPEQSAALYNLSASASDVDTDAGRVANASRLHVVYLPYATGADTGLPTSPGGQGPWLMEAGQPWAHVMYSFSE